MSQKKAGITKRLLRYLKPYKRQFAVALFCMVLFGASDGVIPFLIKYILDGVFADQNKSLLFWLPIALVVFAVFRALFDFGQEFLMSKVGHNIVRDIRRDLNNHILHLSPSFFFRESSGNLLARITSDVTVVKAVLTSSVASVIRDSIRIIALLIAAIYLDWVLAMIAFIIFPVAIVPVYLFGKRVRKLSKRGQDYVGAISGLMQESILGNKVVKIFGREEFEKSRFETDNERLTKTFVSSEKARALVGPMNEVFAAIAVSAIILYGGYSVIGGIRSQGDFIAFLAAVFLLYEPFKKLSKVHQAIQQGLSGAERIFEVLDADLQIVDPKTPKPLPIKNTITFERVSFAYPDSAQAALSEISLTIEEGQHIALVGFSGAGKSTFVDLIPRFLDPTEGRVLLGGLDIREVKLKDLRSRIAMVGQHTFLFQDTIFNNIRYGKLEATEEEVIEAARAAYAYDFVMSLPQGFETNIGEAGITLSGGERQRIAIARALLKDAPILILDEATASLDNRAEREVQAALDKLQENRTSVTIAHRLSTIKEADYIVVLSEGKIVELGSHQELLAREGEYERLYALQFASIRGESASSGVEKR